MPSTDDHALLTLDPRTAVAQAATAVLSLRFGAVARLVTKAVDSKLKGASAVKLVHALRVSTRRAQAALDAFAHALNPADREEVTKVLRSIRKAAGAMRDAHVQYDALRRAAKAASNPAQRDALDHLADRSAKARVKARVPLLDALAAVRLRRLTTAPEPIPNARGTHQDAARAALTTQLDAIRTTAAGDLHDLVHVHELRVELKTLRYTVQQFISCVPEPERAAALKPLAAIQELLGTVNDAFTLRETIARRLERLAPKAKASDAQTSRLLRGLKSLVADQGRQLKAAHRAFLMAWKKLASAGDLDRLLTLVAPFQPRPADIEIKPLSPSAPRLNGQHRAPRLNPKRRRLAAIDVGTNSVRLIVAEAAEDGAYRVLDDEKEITRLGTGMHETGRMNEARIEHTAATIARMRSIAEGYGVTDLRVVGTSAARDATNAPALLARVLETSGLRLEVVSGDHEAMLAFRSAERAFDLSSQPALVFDIGGGSVELVLSAGAGQNRGALIERVYSLPLGAVVLTERFGGPDAASVRRFDELREHVQHVLRKSVGTPPLWPQAVIGTGGTLTTLGLMSLRESPGEHSADNFGKVQGTAVARAQIRHLLEYVRKLPVKDRPKVPGLGADRADIIVAGLAVVDAVLKHFGANTLKVHEGGIRDGLLLSMVEPAAGPGGGESGRRPDPLKSVRRFAKECNYEAAHSEQVARLAMNIFDGLAPHQSGFKLADGAGFDAEARVLLEAAAVLHDVGYLINYARHHKHSYHLIVHADLPGLTTRQVQVIANVARYHRAAEPKAKHGPFARLAPEDQALVRQLSAILRVADGLDRTHRQSVREVALAATPDSVNLTLAADAEPEVDIWGAVRKSGLFREVFGRVVNVEWTPSPAARPVPKPIARRSAIA